MSCWRTRGTIHRHVASAAWVREAPSVYGIAGARRTWHARAPAAVMSAGPGALASHRTAAHLWGLEGFPAPGRIDVTVPRHARPQRRSSVVTHETLTYDLASATRR